jgi:hypothetical protein
MTDFLTKAEHSQFQKLEERIDAGLQSFFEVGSALLEIRDGRLYRQNFFTFSDYCQEKWDMPRQHAYRLMDATRIRQELEDAGIEALPQHERQLRPLSKIKTPEERVEVYEVALTMSPAGDKSAPASPVVQRAVDARLPKLKPSPKPEQHQCVECGTWHAAPPGFFEAKKKEASQARPGQDEQRRVQRGLEAYFAEISGIPRPAPNTQRARKAASVRWWQPLKEIAELVKWNEQDGLQLIAQAFKHLQSEGILLEAPQSIIKTARALAAGQVAGKQTGLDVLKRKYDEAEAELEAQRGS